MTIPNRIIEGIFNSEIDPEKYYSIYGKEEINKALQNLKESNDEILNLYTPKAMYKAVEAKLSHKNKKPLLIPSGAIKIATYAAAAVFIAAIAIPLGYNSFKARTPAATERLTGPSASVQKETYLSLYRKNGREIQALKDGSYVHSGDVIQITYQAGQNDYGVIFSVDGSGNITRHFPEESWQAAKLEHRSDETPLDFSYELDNAPDFECFVMVTSKKQFSPR